MTKAEKILEKHLKNNVDQRTYLRGSKLTYELCVNAINEALTIASVVWQSEQLFCEICGREKEDDGFNKCDECYSLIDI